MMQVTGKGKLVLKVDTRHSLSVKLLRLVLLWALLAGILLSLAQIFFDLRSVRESIDRDAHDILAMFHDPARQAIFSLDQNMASQEMTPQLLKVVLLKLLKLFKLVKLMILHANALTN